MDILRATNEFSNSSPYIVHRIDKNTSGLLVVAKTDVTHSGLASQFENHSISRHYKAFCYGVINKLDTRLNSHPKIKFEKSAQTQAVVTEGLSLTQKK